MKYEDAAEKVTVTGWACKTCHRWYGDTEGSEHLARWCCATDLPCDCGGRRGKSYTCCEKCRAEHDAARWAARERRRWDGKTPLYSAALELFLFDEEDLANALDEVEGDDLRLLICEPRHAHQLDVEGWLDDLPDDRDPPDWFIHLLEQFNDGLAKHSNDPLSWEAGNVVADVSDWLGVDPFTDQEGI